MNSDELYTSAFLAVLPVCLTHYYRFASDTENFRQNGALIKSAVDEAHHCALVVQEKWLEEKEKTRKRGGRPEKISP
jgi:hypothetical protein